MPKYGIIKDGNLFTSSKQLEGYEPIEYAEIPADFDETTHYITQSSPISKDGKIYVGVEMHEMEIEDDIEYDEFLL